MLGELQRRAAPLQHGATTGGKAVASERAGGVAPAGKRWKQKRVREENNENDEGGALERGGVSVRTDHDGEVGCDATMTQTE